MPNDEIFHLCSDLELVKNFDGEREGKIKIRNVRVIHITESSTWRHNKRREEGEYVEADAGGEKKQRCGKGDGDACFVFRKEKKRNFYTFLFSFPHPQPNPLSDP